MTFHSNLVLEEIETRGKEKQLRVGFWENQTLQDIADGVTSQNSLIFLYVVEGSEFSIPWNFQPDSITFPDANNQNTAEIFDSDFLINFWMIF